ncbi:MAG: STAS/SEC14 domain-containing protein [Candidatus Theseobacter exili]|nr:STAS/SEC14 domain-containing protein [Candidatus Theseobacter exili]
MRLLIDAGNMQGADLKSEWDVFKFLEKHMENLEMIAIVGAHSWTKVMSEVLADSIFVKAETRYFKIDELEHAWYWLDNAVHPKHIPIRKLYKENDGLFTKYGSPNYV